MEDIMKFIVTLGILVALGAGVLALPDLFNSVAEIEQARAEIAQAEVSLKALEIAQGQMFLTGVLVVTLGLVFLVLIVLVSVGAVLFVREYWRGQAVQNTQLFLGPGQGRRLSPPQDPSYHVVRVRKVDMIEEDRL